MREESSKINGVYLKNNPLEIPPVPTVKKGNKAIGDFLEEIEKIRQEEKKEEEEKKERLKKERLERERRKLRGKKIRLPERQKIPIPEKPQEKQQLPKIFISYSHKDMDYKDTLVIHLAALVRANEVNVWDDGKLIAGQRWKQEIFDHLYEADVVLCLISADFIASDFCHEKELKAALQADKEGRQTVIPIRIRVCAWGKLPISTLQAPPTDWMRKYNDDASWTQVINAIQKAFDNLKDS